MPNPMTRCHMIVPVWGEEYVRLFLDCSLPTQITPGNLGSPREGYELVYKIYTRSQDVSAIAASPVLAYLKTLLPVQVIPAAEIDFSEADFYRPFSACYMRAIREAASEDAACLFLTADQVWSEGSLARILERGREGYRAVMISGPRVEAETFLPYFQTRAVPAREPWVSIAPRELVRIALDHLHPWDRSLFWDEDNRGRPASFLCWDVGGEGILMRCFHLHPVLVHPARPCFQFEGTIDAGDYVRDACPDPRTVYIVDDSDEVMYFSVAPARQSAELIDRPRVGLPGLLLMAQACAMSRYNYQYLRKKIRLHTGALSPRWQAVESQSDRLIEPVLRMLDNPVRVAYYRVKKRFLHTWGPILRPWAVRMGLRKDP